MGAFSAAGDIMSTMERYLEYRGGGGGGGVPLRMFGILSTIEDVRYHRGISSVP